MGNQYSRYALKLAKEYWPGPMTLILERSKIAKNFITGGQETVGLRVPAHLTTLALLKEFHKLGGNGIAAPSANRFGAVSPTNADAVQSELGEFLYQSRDLIIDAGSACFPGFAGKSLAGGELGSKTYSSTLAIFSLNFLFGILLFLKVCLLFTIFLFTGSDLLLVNFELEGDSKYTITTAKPATINIV